LYEFSQINNKINRIIISAKLIERIKNDKNLDNKYHSSSDFQKSPHKAYFIGDFNNEVFIKFGNDNPITYSKGIEYNTTLRKWCKKLALINFGFPKIIKGYWKFDYEEQNVRYMTLSDWGDICQSLPNPTELDVNGVKIMFQNISTKWVEELKQFLVTFFTKLFSLDGLTDDELSEYVDAMTNENAINIWVRGFTHATQNAIYNYESLEHYGDRMLIGPFRDYMGKRFERITHTEASGFQLQYLSAEYQCYWSDDLNLSGRVMKSPIIKDSKKLKTDMLESFIGCASTVALKYYDGFQFLIVSKIITLIGESIPFDKEMVFGKPKQKVIQINETLGFTNQDIIVQTTNIKDKNGNVKVRLTPILSQEIYLFYESKDRERIKRDGVSLTSINNLEIYNFPFSYLFKC